MKFLLLAGLSLTAATASASEYQQRKAIYESELRARYDEEYRQRAARARAEEHSEVVNYVSRSLGISPSQIQRTGEQEWRTLDGSIVCGARVFGWGKPALQCLDSSGRDVIRGSYEQQLQKPAKRAAKTKRRIR